MCVVAYVSGHGFGHAAREIEILRRLPADIPLVVKSLSAEWFWRQEMDRRPFEFVAEGFDVGCQQHDSIHIDIPATLTAWHQKDAHNREREQSEADDLRRRGARVVVSDVAAFPLTIAHQMGQPGILIANFTWADIYAAFITNEPGFAPVVDSLIHQYRATTVCLDTDLSLPMVYLPRKERVGLVCRPGRPRRVELAASLRPNAKGKHLALVYLGAWGYPIPYERLEAFADWHFVSIDAPPVPVANWSTVSRDLMSHPDLVASVDLVVSKPGYGIVAECLSQGTPFLHSPRPAFAEYAAIEAVLRDWSGSLPMSEEAFLKLEWKETLARVPSRLIVPTVAADGGAKAAQIITDFYRNGGPR